jgi:SP family sugar porter-like MFS transporter
MGIGLASNMSPVYIAEVSPANIRGRFVAINQLTIVIGILLAQFVNWTIAKPVPEGFTGIDILESWNGQHGWRLMFLAEIVPASLFFILMWLVPDSPRWLIKKGKSVKAYGILSRIGGEEYADLTKDEIKDTLAEKEKRVKIKELLNRSVIPVLIIGIVLAVFQQWCGINVIFLFADEVFSSAGYEVSDMLFNVVITGSINLIFTLAAMALVDKIGRKALMLIGSGGLAIIYTIIGILYKTGVQGTPLLILVLAAIACYAMTLAPVVWVVLSEIFPNKFRGTAMAISTFALWTGNTMLAFFFPIINDSIQISGSFFLFACICVLGLLFIVLRVRETKGKSLEEIEKEILR